MRKDKNVQGDIVGLIDSTGALVVEYKYDAWGNPISTRTLTSEYDALAELNPFRYRGYVWDNQTTIYYLFSRYYSPYMNRFLNADTSGKHIRSLSSNNLFAYCKNTPIHTFDPDGKDLYVITATSGAYYFGHTSLLIQDENDEWYYYYYGAKRSDDYKMLLGYDTEAAVIYSKLDYSGSLENVAEAEFFASISEGINELHDAAKLNRQIYDRAVYIEGDFTPSHRAALKQLGNASKERYNLYTNNCVINSLDILEETIPYIHSILNIETGGAVATAGIGTIFWSVPFYIGLVLCSTVTPNAVHTALELVF